MFTRGQEPTNSESCETDVLEIVMWTELAGDNDMMSLQSLQIHYKEQEVLGRIYDAYLPSKASVCMLRLAIATHIN